jgi:TatD DNase family protein
MSESETSVQESALPNLYDAHNHLQDERLAPVRETMIVDLRRENVRRMVVNGSCEQDWPAVLELAKAYPEVIPSFGYHPWYIKERSDQWERKLAEFLDEVPAGVGEIGLDRWIREYDLEDQEKMFVQQLRLAAERNAPVSIHCLQAWGRLFDLLELHPRPRCGFVLHSFGGPPEMIPALARLGAYFSLPGYYAHARKARQQQSFKQVPRDRLLIETDAPDQTLPQDRVKYPLSDSNSGKPLNHPANLGQVYAFASELLEESTQNLARQVEANFHRLFGMI